MQSYKFAPGSDNRGNNLKQYLKNEYLRTVNRLPQNEKACLCIEARANDIKQGFLDPQVSASIRTSQILLTNAYGGQVQFGNTDAAQRIHFLGGVEGQSGGLPQPPRNKR